MKKSRSSVKPVSFWANPLLPFVIGLLAMAFLVFGNSLSNGYAYDDKPFIERNFLVQQGVTAIPELLTTNFWAGYTNASSANPSYRPLPLITLAIEYQVFGLRPGVNHFFNLVYYGLSVVMLFLLLNLFLRQSMYG